MTDWTDRARRAGLLAPEFLATLLLLAVAVVLGGSSRPSFGNLLVQLTALGVLTFLLIRRQIAWPAGMAGGALALLLVIAALPLLYTLPVPPAVWSGLAGRGVMLHSYTLAGITPPWHGIGLRDGIGTMTALHMLAPIVMFVTVTRLTAVQRWGLLYGFLAVALLAMLIGFAQVPGGAARALHFYTISSINGALGFFPNRNHMATMMLCTLPLAAVAALVWLRERGDEARGLGIAGAVLFGLAILALVATAARAGLVISIPVLIGCALLARVTYKPGRSGPRPLVLWGAVVLALTAIVGGLAVSSLGGKLAARFTSQGVLDSDRIEFARLTAATVPHYLPLGSGPMTFRPIYTMIEPIGDMQPFFINHAHDDYLEIVLEYGVPGGLLLVAALAWLGWAAARAWADRDAEDRAIRRAATIAIGAVLLHSTFDYPLRTTTIAVLFAMLAALALASAPGTAPALASPKRVRRRQRIRIA